MEKGGDHKGGACGCGGGGCPLGPGMGIRAESMCGDSPNSRQTPVPGQETGVIRAEMETPLLLVLAFFLGISAALVSGSCQEPPHTTVSAHPGINNTVINFFASTWLFETLPSNMSLADAADAAYERLQQTRNASNISCTTPHAIILASTHDLRDGFMSTYIPPVTVLQNMTPQSRVIAFTDRLVMMEKLVASLYDEELLLKRLGKLEASVANVGCATLTPPSSPMILLDGRTRPSDSLELHLALDVACSSAPNAPSPLHARSRSR